MKKIRVLVACEFSGRVREAFRCRGFDAWSCDLLPTEIPGPHIQGNVLDILGDGWDLMIAHPPCTYICNSGVRWLHSDSSRWAKMEEAVEFFKKLLYAPIPHICVENPIPHKYALRLIGMKYTQIIQPYYFGEPLQKATCLWLINLPMLKRTVWDLVPPKDKEAKKVWQRLYFLPPTSDRWKRRSITSLAVAEAMAEQWGLFLRSLYERERVKKADT